MKKEKPTVLPYQIKVGKHVYAVECGGQNGYIGSCTSLRALGTVSYTLKRIVLYPHASPAQLRETFWHEVTHAVLFEMGEKVLCHSEDFVERFSKLLSRAIDSAQFK